MYSFCHAQCSHFAGVYVWCFQMTFISLLFWNEKRFCLFSLEEIDYTAGVITNAASHIITVPK